MTKQKLTFPFEIKASSMTEEDGMSYAYFEGYAATFGNTDSVDDVIMKGAFTDSLKRRKVKMCWQHRFNEVIGSFTEIKEDDAGLFVKGRLNLGVEKAREAYALIKSGDLDSMSIGYSTIVSEYNSETNVRLLKELELYEISIVTEPANALATITNVKSLEQADSLKSIEQILHDNGFSNNECKLLISRVKQLLNSQREVEEKEAKEQREVAELLEIIKSTSQTLKV